MRTTLWAGPVAALLLSTALAACGTGNDAPSAPGPTGTPAAGARHSPP